MSHEYVPPKPSHKPFEQQPQPEKRQIPRAVKFGAGAGAIALLGTGFYVSYNLTKRGSGDIEANPAATTTQDPTKSPTATETSTPSTEPSLYPSPSALPTPETEPTISTYDY